MDWIKKLFKKSGSKERKKRTKKRRFKRMNTCKATWRKIRKRVIENQRKEYYFLFCANCGKFLREK